MDRVRVASWEGTVGGTVQGMAVLPFALVPGCPRCLWCRHAFTPSKPNQLYCKAKHRQRACECRKAALVTALAAFLQGHGASLQRAQNAAVDVVEAHYATGRVQRAVEALGWCYDEVGRTWRGRAA